MWFTSHPSRSAEMQRPRADAEVTRRLEPSGDRPSRYPQRFARRIDRRNVVRQHHHRPSPARLTVRTLPDVRSNLSESYICQQIPIEAPVHWRAAPITTVGGPERVAHSAPSSTSSAISGRIVRGGGRSTPGQPLRNIFLQRPASTLGELVQPLQPGGFSASMVSSPPSSIMPVCGLASTFSPPYSLRQRR